MGCRALVVLSDTHCGSDVGLCPPVVKIGKGNYVEHGDNIVQKWLWQHWVAMEDRVLSYLGNTEFGLLINGDATEGSHHHNNTDLIAADIVEHVAIAAMSLRRLSSHAKKVFVVKGTECHTRNMEKELAVQLGAEGKDALDAWHFSIRGCPIEAKHHMPTTSRRHLEASALSICMSNALSNYSRCHHSLPRVFLRGHRHCGGFYDDGDSMIGVTGAWQFLTRHGHKVATDSIPRPSVIILDWRDRDKGELPTPHMITFNPPDHETVEA